MARQVSWNNTPNQIQARWCIKPNERRKPSQYLIKSQNLHFSIKKKIQHFTITNQMQHECHLNQICRNNWTKVLKKFLRAKFEVIDQNNINNSKSCSKIKCHKQYNGIAAALVSEAGKRRNYSLLPLLPPFLRVLSVGMGVTSSAKRK